VRVSYNKAEGTVGFRTRLCLICLLVLRLAPKAGVLGSPESVPDWLKFSLVPCMHFFISEDPFHGLKIY
jgi:hypothetical protein